MQVDTTGERGYAAERYRLQGKLTLHKFAVPSDPWPVATPQPPTPPTTHAEVDACFLKALEIARTQQAKSLEWRAATSLARLWQQQGKRKGARQMLSEIYGWFTEGLDTADLQEAKALLEELAG